MTKAIKIDQTLQELVNDIASKTNAVDGSQKMAGIDTGFNDLDKVTSGMRRGSLIVIASRPSMGKTALALNIASHVVLNSKFPVLVISPGLSAMQITLRLVCQDGGIDPIKLHMGALASNDRISLDAAVAKFREAPLFIDDSPSQSVKEIELTCRDVIAQTGRLGLIVVDDLQSMVLINEEVNETDVYEETMCSFKKLARDVDTPIMLLSRLSSQLEQRRIKRPNISDLPDRMIGQYSDLLIFLYRDEVYNPDSDAKGTAELIIGRHRFGATVMITLGTFKLQFGKFSNYRFAARQEEQEMALR